MLIFFSNQNEKQTHETTIFIIQQWKKVTTNEKYIKEEHLSIPHVSLFHRAPFWMLLLLIMLLFETMFTLQIYECYIPVNLLRTL